MLLLAGVDNVMQCQLLFALESLHANLKWNLIRKLHIAKAFKESYIASMRAIGNVRQLVSRKVVLALEGGITDVADKAALNGVLNDMLLHQVAFWQCHLTFRATVEDRPIKGSFLANLTGLKQGNL